MSRDLNPLRSKMVVEIKMNQTVVKINTRNQYNVAEYGQDKENILAKESSVSNLVVDKSKAFYPENITINCTNWAVPETQGAPKFPSTGAIKKRKLSENLINYEGEKNTRNNTKFGEIELSKKQFNIYKDKAGHLDYAMPLAETEKKMISNYGGVSARNLEQCPSLPTIDKRFNRLLIGPEATGKFEPRNTPVDFFQIPPAIKKVKVTHKQQLCNKIEETKAAGSAVCRSEKPDFNSPYINCVLEHEITKDNATRQKSNLSRKSVITSQQRIIIVKFLTRVQSHLFLPSYFLYQTVRLFDAILDAKNIKIEDLQLYALAAMWIILKKEHTFYHIPSAKTMIDFAGDLYGGNVNLLLQSEVDILMTLKFSYVFPDPFSVMYHCILKCHRYPFLTNEDIQRAYCCGSYMIDLSLFDEIFMDISAILLAATAAETALYFAMENVDDTVEPHWSIWRSPQIAQSYSDDQICTLRDILLRKMFESQRCHSNVEIIYKKYLRSRYGRISYFLCSKVKQYLCEE